MLPTYCSPDNSPLKSRKPLGFSKLRFDTYDSPDKLSKLNSPDHLSSPSKGVKKILASPEKLGKPTLLIINDD